MFEASPNFDTVSHVAMALVALNQMISEEKDPEKAEQLPVRALALTLQEIGDNPMSQSIRRVIADRYPLVNEKLIAFEKANS